MIRTFTAILLVYLTMPIAFVAAEEVWTCTYPGFSQDRRPVIARYREKDEFLVDDEWNQQYRIMQNNQFGIVASWSISTIERNNSSPSIGARTIVIDKRSGELLWSNTLLGEPDKVNEPVHGNCIRG
jgi:hypothetical protein